MEFDMLEEKPVQAPLLSAREREILTMLSHGLRQTEVAERLVLSLSTVKAHAYRLRKKLGARNLAQAVAIAKYKKII